MSIEDTWAPAAGGPLQPALRFFKALADESRLRLVGILASREASVDELASLLALRPPTVSHHLAKLRQAGLVAMRPEGTSHLYRLDVDALRRASREALAPERMAALPLDGPADDWERKVLRAYFADNRLTEIPASRKKRGVVLKWLAQRFTPGRRYAEVAVNEVLQRYHADAATLRRELVGAGLLLRDHSVYWRPAL